MIICIDNGDMSPNRHVFISLLAFSFWNVFQNLVFIYLNLDLRTGIKFTHM